jgi:putative nucleotidyltransferase with HDIG domain
MSDLVTNNRRIAKRLVVICTLFAVFFGITTHLFVLYSFKLTTTTQALESTSVLDELIDPKHIDQPHAQGEIIDTLNKIITFGIFESITIYDSQNHKIAQASTPNGLLVGGKTINETVGLRKKSGTSFYEYKDKGVQALIIRGPINTKDVELGDKTLGYFEVIRIIPEWRKKQILSIDIWSVLLTIIGTLSVGLILYPIITKLNNENNQRHKEVINSHINMIKSLGEAVAKRDSKTGTHSNRVTWIAVMIAEKMGIDVNSICNLIVGCILHDIGKIGISDNILLKPSKLSPEETEIMHGHVKKGEEIVKGMGWLEKARDVISGHHEKWDGTGYPRQLAGNQISLIARIASVADVFDVLCTTRPYKAPYPYETAIDMMVAESGKHFDPTVMNIFLPISKNIYDILISSNEAKISALLDKKIHQYITVEN